MDRKTKNKMEEGYKAMAKENLEIAESFRRLLFVSPNKEQEVVDLLNPEPVRMYPSIEDARRVIAGRNKRLAHQICQLFQNPDEVKGDKDFCPQHGYPLPCAKCGMGEYERGLREVVEWVNKHLPKTLANYVGFWHLWQAFLKDKFKDNPELLKEWGIEWVNSQMSK